MTLSEKGEMSHVGSRWLNHPLGSGQVTGNISCVSIIRFDGKEATCSIAPSQDCARWWTYKGQMGWENDMSAHEQAQKPFSNFFSIDAVSIDSYVLFFFKRKLVMTSREVSIATNWKLLLNWLLRWWGSLTGLLWMWQSDGLSKQIKGAASILFHKRFWWGSYLVGMWYVMRPGDLVKHSMWCHRVLQRTVSWLTAFCSLLLLWALRCSQGNPSTPESDVKLMPSCFPFVCLIEAALCNYLSLCRL